MRPKSPTASLTDAGSWPSWCASPTTPKDPDPVAVHAQRDGKLGYLKRQDAQRYGQVFQSLEKRGYDDAAACPAMLTGWTDSYGVVPAISAPRYVLGDVPAD